MTDSKYEPAKIEAKWQALWDKERTFKVEETKKDKIYVLDMFPYPSAQGLHVGHVEGYTATDIYCRYLRMKGIAVLHPMGWDAFGLPAENYAIKTGTHPQKLTWQNIDNYRRQLKSLGFSYDWSREINTADPAYYKWTQWLFLQLYEKGLAYQKTAPVNWCSSCQTVLANEQVINGECERCHNQVEQRQMKQWFFKITEYADELLKDLDKLDWPANIVEMQKNWIGKSTGAEVEFKIKKQKLKIKIFTTRLDTIFGATYLVLAPEHKLIQQLRNKINNWPEVEKYIKESQKRTELERKAEIKEKTGVRLKGLVAINPANQEEMPIFIADYVLTSYGTGAIMAVPAHDERDFEFAKKFGLPIKYVVTPAKVSVSQSKTGVHWLSNQGVFEEDGVLYGCEEFNGLSSSDARHKIAKKLGAKLTTKYRLRDWLISRQRYWGAPIPIIYCETCGIIPVPVKDLPVLLPEDVDFKPTGESPLVKSQSFHQVKCPKCGLPAHRENDTMDTFVDSSWYFLRYCDPQNNQEAFNPKKVASWCPVNFYVGGAEHAVMHLLYARFFTKVLADLGYIKFREPFLKLRNQGLILGEDGQKMSKSRGNVINPDEIVEQYGADTLRLYEMFMGPLEDSKPWNTSSIIGVRRFLEKVWRLATDLITEQQTNNKAEEANLAYWSAYTTKKVTTDIESFNFNTAISILMEFSNVILTTAGAEKVKAIKNLLILLYPFAPHLTSELWEKLGERGYIWQQVWPAWQEESLIKENVKIIVQVNGKVRDTIDCSLGMDQAAVERIAKQSIKVAKFLTGKILKVIYVKDRLINFVVE